MVLTLKRRFLLVQTACSRNSRPTIEPAKATVESRPHHFGNYFFRINVPSVTGKSLRTGVVGRTKTSGYRALLRPRRAHSETWIKWRWLAEIQSLPPLLKTFDKHLDA